MAIKKVQQTRKAARKAPSTPKILPGMMLLLVVMAMILMFVKILFL